MNAILQQLGANTYAREAAPADAAFLRRLFDESAMAMPGVPVEMAASLADMQFRGRELSYTAQYPGANDCVLCLVDGAPVGRHLMVRQPDAYRTIDLAVLREHQHQGHATAALEHLRQKAASEGAPLRLRVATTNPALLLYQRLGFLIVANDELSFEMECRPAHQRSGADKHSGTELYARGAVHD